MPKLALHWQILVALIAAALLGFVADATTSILGVTVLSVCDFVGSMFLRALKMVVVPLIVTSVIVAIAGVGDSKTLGRLGLKTAAYYVTTSTLAILIGLFVVQMIAPGIVDGEPARESIGLSGEMSEVAAKVEGKTAGDVVGVFLRMIPVNVIAAAAEGQMLGLIFFCLLFGFFLGQLPEARRAPLLAITQSGNDVMLRITDWVMTFAPIGVFGLVAKVVLMTGMAANKPIAAFFFSVVLALGIHAFVVLPLLLWTVGRVSPLRHFRAMSPAMLMAFSTASSSATLPLTIDRVQNGAGVSKRVSSFTLPLGATVNMDGTALYECVAALFIAQAYGLELGPTEQFTVVLVALLTSIGVAGIPAASLVAITLILTTIGLPVEAIGLILAVDRVLDMCRTAVNVFSDSTAAVVIARLEGEEDVLQAPSSSS